MIGISLRQLEVFAAVAGEGSVRAAAGKLHLSQPALSMALAELEAQLGVTLFDRQRGRLYLSERGREALPLAQEILERTVELKRSAQGRSDVLDGELRLGASNTIGNYLVGDLLGAFAAAHPQVSIRLAVGNTDAIVKGVLDHALDLGCVEGAVVHADIEVRPWRDDELVICARPDHALARRKRLAARDFAGARWILREDGSGTRAMTERILASLPPGQTVLELGQSEAIKQAVIAGLGIAVLPAIAVGDAVKAQRLVALPTPFLDLRRRLSWILRRSRYHGALVGAFLDSATRSDMAALKPPGRTPRSRRNTRG
ncbi:MAG: LysR family transcriptional regulator [Rudaea sp.]|uniref:LysR family transcriptional regulator n=1 Tax=unclassified Rudaea TaxID=2627037 RepID=UPI0010F89F98|nr:MULTISPECIES: LysR family transcriptional regulator [unclassified Rudaea]MBN8886760.1 LysR family transcriptional regulator [Rudaea sp.]MBR0347836.1 LysR family transcriptional regulator [Rudaea sp.]